MNTNKTMAIIGGLVCLQAGCTLTGSLSFRTGDSRPSVTPTEPLSHTVTVDGHPLALWEKSPPKPKGSILLIHGRTWSSLPDFDLYAPGENLSLMDALKAEGYATYALDLRGYGDTPRDETGWLTPNRAAADVAEVLDWIARRDGLTSKPVLFGWSMGSRVSQLCAQLYPERMSAIVLFGYPGNPAARRPERPDPPEPLRRENTARAAASDFIVPGSISQSAIDAYVRLALRGGPGSRRLGAAA